MHVKKGVFNCRGCGKGGGGAIDLVMFLDKANFEQAVETITGSPPPKEDKNKKKKSEKGNGAAKPWSPVIARYTYRKADGTPYLQVCRTAAKGCIVVMCLSVCDPG